SRISELHAGQADDPPASRRLDRLAGWPRGVESLPRPVPVLRRSAGAAGAGADVGERRGAGAAVAGVCAGLAALLPGIAPASIFPPPWLTSSVRSAARERCPSQPGVLAAASTFRRHHRGVQ